jgi:hypothetical protein
MSDAGKPEEKLDAARIIKDAVDRVIKLDPRNDLGWHILGRWHLGFAEVSPAKRALALLTYGKLPNSTYEDAAKCFLPPVVQDLLELGINPALKLKLAWAKFGGQRFGLALR